MPSQLVSKRPIVTGIPRTRLDKYKAWVRTLPCPCGCHRPVEFQHLKHILNFSGTSLKAPDILGHPACRELHGFIHASPRLYKYNQVRWIFDTLARAVAVGVLQVHDPEERG